MTTLIKLILKFVVKIIFKMGFLDSFLASDGFAELLSEFDIDIDF